MSPGRPHIGDPGGSPRIASSGAVSRGRPILRRHGGGDGKGAWSVAVTPLEGGGARGVGRLLNGGGRAKPRAVFEVRAEYLGIGLPEFGSQPDTQRIESFNTEDEVLARAVAERAAQLLGAGERDVLLNAIAEDVKRRRA